jgi:hypothetical protein
VVYGDPRFTRDIDVVLDLDPSAVSALLAAFDPAAFYVPPQEALVEEIQRVEGGHFNIIDRASGLRADIYLRGDDPLHGWAFERRVRIEAPASGVWVAPIEYVIVRKLQYFALSDSERHLRDVAMMFRISGDAIDREALDCWVAVLDLGPVLERAMGYEPR